MKENGKVAKVIKEKNEESNGVSRRDFLKQSARGAGVAAVALGSARSALAADDAKSMPDRAIHIPDELTAPRTAAPQRSV